MKRILIIDDEENIRRVMRLTLEAAGYEVGEASSGAEGLEQYGDGIKWDAVVLDQRMPGLDGLETLRHLKQRNGATRVIMATAYASIELAVDAMKLGATDFVRKPLTPEVLRNAVTAALSKSFDQIATDSLNRPVDIFASQPLIQTVTMNGFTILDEKEVPALEPHQRRFIVVTPQGIKHDVLVEIDREAVGYVERLTGRRLPPENSFWTAQAHRLLSDFLWNEGKVPPTRRLIVKDIDPDKLPIAARWGSTAG